MKCSYHATEDSVESCSICRRLLCAACSHSIKGSICCQDCLVQGEQLARLALEILCRRLTVPGAPLPKPLSLPIWGGLLILLGLLFFLENLEVISFSSTHRFWPLAFVFLGLYLIYSHYRQQEPGIAPPLPGPDETPRAGPAESGDSAQR